MKRIALSLLAMCLISAAAYAWDVTREMSSVRFVNPIAETLNNSRVRLTDSDGNTYDIVWLVDELPPTHTIYVPCSSTDLSPLKLKLQTRTACNLNEDMWQHFWMVPMRWTSTTNGDLHDIRVIESGGAVQASVLEQGSE